MKNTKVVLGAVLALGLSCSFAQDFCNDTGHTGQKVEVTSNKTGTIGNVGYELWNEGGNHGSATFYEDGSFTCTISGATDYLCRAGLSYGMDNTKSHSEIGHIMAEFSLKKDKSKFSGINYSYIGIYGWTRNPLVEWYIVDTWGSQGRPQDWVTGGSTKKNHGFYEIDGAQYEVIEGDRTSYSIEGDNKYFRQFWSIRKDERDCGLIDISAHFKKWEELGMKLGALYEAKVLGEAGGSGATAYYDFNHVKVYVEGDKPASSSSTPASSAVEPKSSSSEKPASSGTTALANVQFQMASNTYMVFDMQGKYLGTVEQNTGLTLSQTIKAKFGNAGTYLVKNGNQTHAVSVK
ncbi:MAG: glycoside hydrolase family 11 protein [Fibrobacteraceae bacterium]|nr:glycoside hydrolase family 11 protein [Fibrobacteraceae bacterium]